jgi:hypothetical protein
MWSWPQVAEWSDVALDALPTTAFIPATRVRLVFS